MNENEFKYLIVGGCAVLIFTLLVGWASTNTLLTNAQNEIVSLQLQLKESNAQKNALLKAISPATFTFEEDE